MESLDSQLAKHLNLMHVNINYVGVNLDKLVVKSAVQNIFGTVINVTDIEFVKKKV